MVFGLAIFSASANKLPGYVLPLLPAIAAMAALALDEMEDARGWLGACAFLLVVFPIAAPVLPAAVANEWDAAPKIAFHWTWLLPAVPLVAVLVLERERTAAGGGGDGRVRHRGGADVSQGAVGGGSGALASARELAAEARRHTGQVCAGGLKRDWQYGLALLRRYRASFMRD